MNATAAPDDSNRKGRRLKTFTGASGQRFRTALMWDACPASATGTPPTGVGVDFDLFLLYKNGASSYYVYASQSNDDNREGFDINLPATGNYELWVSYPIFAGGVSPCGSSHEPYWLYGDLL